MFGGADSVDGSSNPFFSLRNGFALDSTLSNYLMVEFLAFLASPLLKSKMGFPV